MGSIFHSYLFAPFFCFILVFSPAFEETYKIYGSQKLAQHCQSDPK